MAGELSILVAFGGGLFSFLSPCVLPLFPSYLSFITGMSLDQLQSAAGDARGRRWILANSLAFVVGFSMVFVGMGASFSALGQLLFDYRERIRLVGGILIIIFGLYVAGVLRLGFLGRYQQIQLRSKPAGLVGSWLVGVTFAIGWTPCVGPILGSILSCRSSSRRWHWERSSPRSAGSAPGCGWSSAPRARCWSWSASSSRPTTSSYSTPTR